ncbi:hypothetical protein ScPMuIL_005012 [Solemya velum]
MNGEKRLICGEAVEKVVAFATPGWFRVAGINMGIWYMCVNGTCASNSDVLAGMKMSGATMSVYTTGFEEFQIESTLGLITGIIAMVVLCAFSRSSRHKKRESETWAAGLCIVSDRRRQEQLQKVSRGQNWCHRQERNVLYTDECRFCHAAVQTSWFGVELQVVDELDLWYLFVDSNWKIHSCVYNRARLFGFPGCSLLHHTNGSRSDTGIPRSCDTCSVKLRQTDSATERCSNTTSKVYYAGGGAHSKQRLRSTWCTSGSDRQRGSEAARQQFIPPRKYYEF